MQNKIFLHTLQENKDNPQILVLIRELAFDLSKKKFKELKSDQELNEEVSNTFGQMCEILRSENLLNSKSVANLIDGITSAASESKEQFLYKLIYEKERIEKQIDDQIYDIKRTIQATLESIESHIQNGEFEEKEQILNAIDDAMLCDLQMLGILRETTEAAFLTTIEKGEDVRDTSAEIAKNIVYSAINEGVFSKIRFLEIAEVVIETAVTIANEDHSFAKELINGSVTGARDGILKAIEKFKEEMKFAPDSENLIKSAKELVRIEDDFVTMLKNLMQRSNDPAASIISDLLENTLDSYFAKFKRMQNEIGDQLAIRLEELKMNENINKFTQSASVKFETLKREFNEKSDKLMENLEVNEKLEALKKEIAEFEKKASEKLEGIKYEEIGENLKTKAKKLGDRIYESAENFIKTAKEKINKKD